MAGPYWHPPGFELGDQPHFESELTGFDTPDIEDDESLDSTELGTDDIEHQLSDAGFLDDEDEDEDEEENGLYRAAYESVVYKDSDR